MLSCCRSHLWAALWLRLRRVWKQYGFHSGTQDLILCTRARTGTRRTRQRFSGASGRDLFGELVGTERGADAADIVHPT